MNAFQLAARHWIAASIVVLLTVASLFLVLLTVSPTYSIDASFVLTYPDQSSTKKQAIANNSNPFLRYSDAATVAQVLAERVRGGSVLDAITRSGRSADFSLTTSTALNSSPQIIYAELNDKSPGATLKSMENLASVLSAQLREMQQDANAYPASFITLTPAGIPSRAVPGYTSVFRAVLGVALLGVIAVGIVVSVLERRRLRSQARD